MKFKQKPVTSAVTLALLGLAFDAHAQTPQRQETVTVTGIRASIEKSLETKRNSDGVVEVITAEDVGKAPDKNIADAVSRLPGVTISSQAGGSGGFDENDRVSLRGTNPSLTQTLVNGHPISTGDWFVLDQVTAVGRSVSFSLLPSELVSQVIVRKSATADLVEGGVAGAVDIITRKPLQFSRQVTLEGSVGAVYADLPKKTDPQVNVLINWKNDAGTMGVMGQAFLEKRHLRRDGQEILSYGTIAASNPIAVAHPDLAGVSYPGLIGSALFEQERERKGGLIDVQIKPMANLELDFTAFQSRMEATNYNRNWMMWGSRIINEGRMPSSYTVRNGTLVAATWPNVGTAASPVVYGVVDDIYRPDAFSETNFFNFDARYRVSDRLSFSGQLGYTKGRGEGPKQAVFEGDIPNTGASFAFHGLGSPTDVSFPSGNPSSFTGTTLDWIFGASPSKSDDDEKYGKIDGEVALDAGVFNVLKFGARVAEHTRETTQVAQGPGTGAFANLPNWNGTLYPSNFGSRLGGGNFPRTPWMLTPQELIRWGDIYTNRDPVSRHYWPGEFRVNEKVSAIYAMVNLDGNRWTGNAGVRFVRTEETVTANRAIPDSVCAAMAACSVPGAITGSAFGSYYQQDVVNKYNDVLPSANLKLDLGGNMVARFAAARTMARPDYSALGAFVTADDTNRTGNGGNPNLKPIRSTNLDATWEWYFAPRALVSAGVFYMDLTNYVAYGTYQTQLLNIRTGTTDTYTISAPTNSKGRVHGLELAWQQPLGMGFGLAANYTYANGKENKSCAAADVACRAATDELVGTSKNTYNVSAYYEDHGFGARIAYTFRSAFFAGLDRATPMHQDDTGTLAASLSYNFTRNVSLNFDALNLNDPVLKYYAANRDQPAAFYANGRQYYLTVRIKL
ncbi:MAG TPA: TonB-dependent receptor [Usitatibacter sp.]|nr:TonB-dependent receptor [Usitatibacter sp.]